MMDTVNYSTFITVTNPRRAFIYVNRTKNSALKSKMEYLL